MSLLYTRGWCLRPAHTQAHAHAGVVKVAVGHRTAHAAWAQGAACHDMGRWGAWQAVNTTTPDTWVSPRAATARFTHAASTTYDRRRGSRGAACMSPTWSPLSAPLPVSLVSPDDAAAAAAPPLLVFRGSSSSSEPEPSKSCSTGCASASRAAKSSLVLPPERAVGEGMVPAAAGPGFNGRTGGGGGGERLANAPRLDGDKLDLGWNTHHPHTHAFARDT